MNWLKGVTDTDLLTFAALMTALLTLVQREGLTIPPGTTLREFTQACVIALQERGIFADVANSRVIVIAGNQITEWSDGYPFTKDNSGDLKS